MSEPVTTYSTTAKGRIALVLLRHLVITLDHPLIGELAQLFENEQERAAAQAFLIAAKLLRRANDVTGAEIIEKLYCVEGA